MAPAVAAAAVAAILLELSDRRVIHRTLVGHLAAEERLGRIGIPCARHDILAHIRPMRVHHQHRHRLANVCYKHSLNIAEVACRAKRQESVTQGETGSAGGRARERLLCHHAKRLGIRRLRVVDDLGLRLARERHSMPHPQDDGRSAELSIAYCRE